MNERFIKYCKLVKKDIAIKAMSFFIQLILAVSSSLIFSIVIPVAPYINEIIGQSKLKNANGKNAKHPTPRVADIYAPHVFHGISEEVIVALSSKALDKFLAC